MHDGCMIRIIDVTLTFLHTARFHVERLKEVVKLN